MTVTYELAQRTRIRAFRTQQYVLIIAEGELPTPGFDVDIATSSNNPSQRYRSSGNWEASDTDERGRDDEREFRI